jgi:CubicO group peptidase (beta-lactamase class C family)
MKPETVGLSGHRLARLDDVMKRRYVDTGRLPGLLTMVYRRGALAHTGMSGHMDLERGKPMREDAIFRIYSMSKPITAVALMMLAEEGLIGLDDDVATHIPSWRNLGVYSTGMPGIVATGEPAFITTPVERPMKVVDLVTHTSGLTYGFMNRTSVDRVYRHLHIAEPSAEGGLDGMVEKLSTLPLEFSPGTRCSA